MYSPIGNDCAYFIIFSILYTFFSIFILIAQLHLGIQMLSLDFNRLTIL